MAAEFTAGMVDLIAGAATLPALEVAGRAGRTGSFENFGFARGSLPAPDFSVLAAEAVCVSGAFLSGVFAGFLAAVAVAPGAGAVGTIDAILSFSTRTKP